MRDQVDWSAYFRENTRQLLRIPWEEGPQLTEAERADVIASVREFQVGESGEGKHLLQYARQYASRTGDTAYLDALRLFIGEEQRHARCLAQFLQLHGEPLAKRTWTDGVFRLLRRVCGTLEVSVSVLLTAELIALVYYPALGRATGSTMLKLLCEQIARDEIKHIEFQANQLEKLRCGHGKIRRKATTLVEQVLMTGTILVVWQRHSSALRRGGLNFRAFWRECWKAFSLSRQQLSGSADRAQTAALWWSVRSAPASIADPVSGS